jgi:hypothetical protein
VVVSVGSVVAVEVEATVVVVGVGAVVVVAAPGLGLGLASVVGVGVSSTAGAVVTGIVASVVVDGTEVVVATFGGPCFIVLGAGPADDPERIKKPETAIAALRQLSPPQLDFFELRLAPRRSRHLEQ